ncbi:PRC-barrel domain-containing protein [Micromonospora sp. SH-82]|uniref:PRC-barrel domain-containing protein n=1 Tax=Micromonospora sp. SH-82 TaxID=3132938 RepID=UPI003EB6EA4E
MQQSPNFNPWSWRDPAALAGGYDQASPSRGPSEQSDGATDGLDAPGPGTPLDLSGYRVEATDGRVGSIDEATNDVDASYLVVDTGPWIFGRQVLLPAGTVSRVDHLDRIVHVDRSREQIKDSPGVDPTQLRAQEHRDQVGTYFTQTYGQG